MAKKVSVKLDRKGMGEFLRGAEMTQMVGSSGWMIAGMAGVGYEADTWVSPDPGRSGQPRVVSGVRAATWKAAHDNARNNTLLRSRDAGRV